MTTVNGPFSLQHGRWLHWPLCAVWHSHRLVLHDSAHIFSYMLFLETGVIASSLDIRDLIGQNRSIALARVTWARALVERPKRVVTWLPHCHTYRMDGKNYIFLCVESFKTPKPFPKNKKVLKPIIALLKFSDCCHDLKECVNYPSRMRKFNKNIVANRRNSLYVYLACTKQFSHTKRFPSKHLWIAKSIHHSIRLVFLICRRSLNRYMDLDG